MMLPLCYDQRSCSFSLSEMQQHKCSQEWQKPCWQPAISMQRLQEICGDVSSQPTYWSWQGTNPGSLSRAAKYAWCCTPIPHRAWHFERAAQKKFVSKRPSSRVCCQLRLMMCSNWMKFGLLSLFELKNTGYGRHCADEHAKSWLLWLVTVVQRLAKSYGTKFRKLIAAVTPSVISGMLTRKSFQKKRIAVLARIADKQITSNAGIALCARNWLVTFEKPYLFPRKPICITWLLAGSLSNTTCPFSTIMYSEPLPHLDNFSCHLLLFPAQEDRNKRAWTV